MARMNLTERESFLSGVHVAVLAIARPNRGPLVAPVWYWYEPGGNLWFETEPTSRKGRLLRLGTRVSLCVQDESPPYRYVTVEGPVIEIADDDRERHEVPMAIRYLGEERGRAYIDSLPEADWKRYVIHPEHWTSMDGASD